MTMKITLDVSEEFIATLEKKVNEELPGIIQEVLDSNIDEILKDLVLKQLKSCALIYIQSPDFRAKMLDRVKPTVNQMLGIE